MNKLMKILKNKNAVTVIELLIVIFLFGLFMSMIGTVCIQGVRAFGKSRNKLTTQQEAQLAVDRLCRELNESYEPGVNIIKSEDNGGETGEIWDAICFPNCRVRVDGSGDTSMGNGKLKWNKYVVYFKKSGSKDVYRRVITVNNYPSDPFSPEAVPDEKLGDFLSPSYPLNCTSPYSVSSGTITDDKKIARDIYSIEFDLYNPSTALCGISIIHISAESRIKTGTDPNGEDLYEHTIITTYVKPVNK